MSEQWYYSRDHQQLGPVSLKQLRDLLAAGQVSPDDLVWSAELPGWTAARLVPAISGQAADSDIPLARTASPAAATFLPGQAELLAYSSANTHQPVLLTPRALDMLRRTQGWTRFFSILIFLGAGLTALVLIAAVLASGLGGEAIIVFLVILAVSLLSIVPGVHLWRFSSRVGQLIAGPREDRLEEALDAQRAFWKFVGMLILVSIALQFGLSMLAGLR